MKIKFLDGSTKEFSSLRSANLRSANLYGANLGSADLTDTKCLSAFNIAAQGTLKVWKKLAGGYIAELKIPAVALRVNAYSSRKCRADTANVVSITNTDGTAIDGVKTKKFSSQHDETFTYKVGKTVSVNDFCADPRIECAAGIHFFITRDEAVNH